MAATNAAVAEREKALDPLASPDITKARAAMEDAAFTRDRLRTVLPGCNRSSPKSKRRSTRRDGTPISNR